MWLSRWKPSSFKSPYRQTVGLGMRVTIANATVTKHTRDRSVRLSAILSSFRSIYNVSIDRCFHIRRSIVSTIPYSYMWVCHLAHGYLIYNSSPPFERSASFPQLQCQLSAAMLSRGGLRLVTVNGLPQGGMCPSLSYSCWWWSSCNPSVSFDIHDLMVSWSLWSNFPFHNRASFCSWM